MLFRYVFVLTFSKNSVSYSFPTFLSYINLKTKTLLNEKVCKPLL